MLPPMKRIVLKKASLSGAFFVCALLYQGFLVAAMDECRPCQGKLLDVRRVVDGDTLLLNQGDYVRLIGINTPELGRDGDKDEEGAQSAKRALEAMVEESGGQVYLCSGIEQRDRFGRLLAHLSGKNGQDIVYQLIRQGHGHAIAVPPNLNALECRLSAETLARDDRFGGMAKSSNPSKRAVRKRDRISCSSGAHC
jgi:endonuclease YncB( thermonuclease family)